MAEAMKREMARVWICILRMVIYEEIDGSCDDEKVIDGCLERSMEVE